MSYDWNQRVAYEQDESIEKKKMSAWNLQIVNLHKMENFMAWHYQADEQVLIAISVTLNFKPILELDFQIIDYHKFTFSLKEVPFNQWSVFLAVWKF